MLDVYLLWRTILPLHELAMLSSMQKQSGYVKVCWNMLARILLNLEVLEEERHIYTRHRSV